MAKKQIKKPASLVKAAVSKLMGMKPSAKKPKVKTPAPAKMSVAKPAKKTAVKNDTAKKTPVKKDVAKNEVAKKETLKASAKVKAKEAVQSTTAVLTKPEKKAAKKMSAAELHRLNACREAACDLTMTTKGYCRLHYIKNWKKIQHKEQILKEKKLNLYIEELVSKYPDKYIEAIRQDLNAEKDFAKVISDLEIEEDIDDFVNAESDAVGSVTESTRLGTPGFDDDDDGF